MASLDRMSELVDQGLTVTKYFAVKAGAKAQDLGERSVLMIEIRQLESQAQKHIGRLGAEVYNALVERKEESVSAESIPIKAILSDIAATRESIEKKDAELKSRKAK